MCIVDVEAAREERRKYDRNWRRMNPSKVKAKSERFWEKHAAPGEDAIAARNRYAREWRAANKEKTRATNLRYWANRAARRKGEAGTGGADEN